MASYQLLGNLDLKNLFDIFEEHILRRLNCVKLGKIKTFYADKQTADIQIDDYPLISGVPVSFISGANFSIQVPVEEGDRTEGYDIETLNSDKMVWKAEADGEKITFRRISSGIDTTSH